jgi:hypothetical protein
LQAIPSPSKHGKINARAVILSRVKNKAVAAIAGNVAAISELTPELLKQTVGKERNAKRDI